MKNNSILNFKFYFNSNINNINIKSYSRNNYNSIWSSYNLNK